MRNVAHMTHSLFLTLNLSFLAYPCQFGFSVDQACHWNDRFFFGLEHSCRNKRFSVSSSHCAMSSLASSLVSALNNSVLVLDGACATVLEQSFVLHPTLWAALAPRDAPEKVKALHTVYLSILRNLCFGYSSWHDSQIVALISSLHALTKQADLAS